MNVTGLCRSFLCLGIFVLSLFCARTALAGETVIEAPGPAGPLRGALRLPSTGPLDRVVLIIPGSGPTDRDGNGPLVKSSTYKLLADALSTRGVSSVRIDKRGLFSSATAIPDANAVTMADYANDIQTWITVIRKWINVPCIWLMGHSEGALVSLAAAETATPVCGLILLAGPGRPMADILREQFGRVAKSEAVRKQAISAIAALEAGKRFDTGGMDATLQPVFRDEVQNFIISLMAVNPTKLVSNFSGRVLIVQGKRDIQVSQVDAKKLKEANPNAELVLLADTNHVLKTVTTDDVQANLATYTDPHLPLASGVVDAIVDFVQASP